MVTAKVSRAFAVTGADDLDAHTDAVMEELLVLEDGALTDSDVSSELSSQMVVISMTATAADFDGAIALADAAIRTAIHAAGGHTPDWRNVEFHPQKQEAELIRA
ncbi:MAG: hypothetical protein ACOYBP_03780 [Microbacteriaceae bacterium]